MELDTLLPQVLTSLFREIVYGPPGDMAFVVNPADPGLVARTRRVNGRRAWKRRGRGTP